MKTINYVLGFMVFWVVDAYAIANNGTLPVPNIIKNSRQLVVVITDSWSAPQGHLQEFFRKDSSEAWQARAQPWEVVVGKNGGKVIDSALVTTKDWRSSEIMSQYPDAYHQGIIVEYNTDEKIPQGGSCIFMHIKAINDQSGTYGCTAMPQKEFTMLSNWLDPKANPVLIQLPRSEYQLLQKTWGLPALYTY